MSRNKARNKKTKPQPQVIPASQVDDQVQNNNSSVVMAERTFIGPIPPPETLADYEKVTPGAADRIIGMAEAEAEHRHEIEKSIVKDDYSEARLGQIFAFLIGTIAILSGCTAAVFGSEVVGALIGMGGVVGLVSVFIVGRKKE